jgi:CRISPR system Cascade subunit CasC
MVTGDILARTDAAIHVAHAMTVHGQMAETDYFTAIDDLIRDEGEQGSGHINASELTSGLFYGYVVIDVRGLAANLGDDTELAKQVLQRLVHIVATVSPGAKRGSTAPYAYSHLVLVEAGSAQPRTLQNAFIEPVRSTGNLIHNTYAAMARHLGDLDSMYGAAEARAYAGLESDSSFTGVEKKTLADLAGWVGSKVA